MAKDRSKPNLPTGRIRRTAPLVGLTSRTAAGRFSAALRRRLGNDQALVEFHERTARRYAERLGNARGALMKLGQMMSFVDPAGFIQPEYAGIYQEAMAGLRDDAEPMSAAVAAAVVEAELGAPVDSLFAEFDPAPLAAASIGQVHRAVRHDGRPVAVKVQYPGVAEAIGSDLANVELLATMMQLIQRFFGPMKHFDARAVAGELRERLREELDYGHEARNQEEWAAIYADVPGIRVPGVHADLSSERVLTTDLATGLTWDQALTASQELRDAWGVAINRFCGFSIYRRGVLHADPQPGNYVFHDDGSVTFLDFGCVKRFDDAVLADFVAIAVAAAEGNAQGLRAALGRTGFISVEEDEAEALLALYRVGFAPVTEPQPFRFTPEYAAASLQIMDPMGENSAITRRLNIPAAFVFTTRLFAGQWAVLASLRASADWRTDWLQEVRAYEERVGRVVRGG